MESRIENLRHEYTKAALNVNTVDSSPVKQFEKWFDEALKAKVSEPNAMSLATSDVKGSPTLRTVLLKAFDEKGFVFYTNYNSTKAAQIRENPKAALMFAWLELERQVIITGDVEKVSKQQSIKYFMTRPFGSKIGAWISNQSHVVNSRKILEMKFEEMKRKFKDGEVPLPDFWGGYRVIPRTVEFWQGRPNRLHDRIFYEFKNENEWDIKRLAP